MPDTERPRQFACWNPQASEIFRVLQGQSRFPGSTVTLEDVDREMGIIYQIATCAPHYLNRAQRETWAHLPEKFLGTPRITVESQQPTFDVAREAYQDLFDKLTLKTPDAFLVLPPQDGQTSLNISPALQKYFDGITAIPHSVSCIIFDSDSAAVGLKPSFRSPHGDPALPIYESPEREIPVDSQIILDFGQGIGQYETRLAFEIPPEIILELTTLMPDAVVLTPESPAS